MRRPADTRDCTNVADADRFRKEVVMDISKKIAIIQNPGLGEFKIRDLNDDINRLLRIKYAWESRIKELGGADYRRIAPKALDKEGEREYSDIVYRANILLLQVEKSLAVVVISILVLPKICPVYAICSIKV